LIYGKVASISLNPIEKKPVFHFLPGSYWLSLGTVGCNFRCPGCQNWELSHADVEKEVNSLETIPPETLVEMALRQGSAGISWTFNEPTLWLEYTLDGARQAKQKGLCTNYVTNGFLTPEALDSIGPYLDVFRVDIKGFSPSTYRKVTGTAALNGVLEATLRARQKWGMHVEVVTNLIPGLNDSPEEIRGLACWIRENLGEETPWHLTQFYPHLQLRHLPPTPLSTLESALDIARSEGLQFVYIGNVWGHPAENTFCPNCGALLIERRGFQVQMRHLQGNRCATCGRFIPGTFKRSNGLPLQKDLFHA